MNKPLCYLLCIVLYDIFLLNANSFYLIDFLIPAFAFLFFQDDKKATLFWLLGLNLFVVFVAISYLLNGEYKLAINLMIRTNLILLLALSLFFRKDQYFITKALFALKFPQKLIVIMMINAKLFKGLLVDLSKMTRVLKARGVRIQMSVFTYKAYANLIGKIVVNSFDKSFGIFQTMKIRGYTNKIGFLNLQRASLLELTLLFLILFDIAFRIYKIYE